MKRIHIFTLLAALTLLLCCILPTRAEAATEGYYTYTVSNSEATITDCDTSISGNVTVPSTLGGYPVTSIGNDAFFGCSSLTSIEIPSSVTSIGDDAFSHCSSLTGITIPDSVTSIGGWVFYGCSSLTGITIPDSVTSIGGWVFYGCSSLTGITIPDSVTGIGKFAFYDCDSLTGITIPGSVTSIGKSAFSDCSSLTGITILEGVTSIGDAAFSDCSSLTSITIPDSVTSIGNYAFYYCSSLEHVAYAGTQEAWNRVTIGTDNTDLLDASRFHYNTTFLKLENCAGSGIYCPVCSEFITWNKTPGTHSFENGVCITCGRNEYFRLTLTEDTTVNLNLEQDLYVGMNGYDLTGTIVTNGYKVYGMDSSTDGYTCDSIGYFTCVDENGNFIVPERTYTYGENQYLAICTEDRYSFHRYFVGVTHMSLAPETVGLGYKSAVFGDEMVFAELADTKAFSFKLQLEGYNPVYRYFDSDQLTSGDPITLRIRNYDVENYGEHNLYAQVSITLSDGTVIEAEQVSLTFRWLAEQVSENYTDYTTDQLAAFKAMLQAFDIVKKWNIPNLI